ncbi:MAG: TetR/AcrR family transcriptional regulator [Pseudolysinimonas sp.]
MPTPDRTSLDDIVRAARDLLESEGLSRLSMQAVADRVGVRAPSLYKRVRNRDDLVRLVAEATVADLTQRLDSVAHATPGDVRLRLPQLARALRTFAHEQPAGYRLVFSPETAATTASAETVALAVEPLLTVVAELAGPDDALNAARTVTAWATGFIAMELAGAFQLGGNLDSAFEFGITRLVAALAARSPLG